MSIGAAVMLVAGYSGWAHFCNPFLGFAVVMTGWFLHLARASQGRGRPGGRVWGQGERAYKGFLPDKAFHRDTGLVRYPLGYCFEYVMGQVDDSALNLLYNLADFVSKTVSAMRPGRLRR